MIDKALHRLTAISLWHLLWIAIFLSEGFTTLLNIGMSLIWWGSIDRDLLLIGLVDGLAVSLIVAIAVVMIVRGVRDLEGRSQTEQRKKEEQCRRVFNSSNDAIIVHDFDGMILEANRAAFEQLGYEEAQLIGMSILELHPPDSLALAGRALQEVSSRGRANFEIDFLTRSAGVFTAEVSSSLFPMDDRNAVLGVLRDITARKQAEAARRESEARYRDLFENAVTPIFITDENHRYVDVNKKAVEVFGFSRDEFLQMTVFDVIPPEQAARSRDQLANLHITGAYESFEGKMRTGDGRWLDIEVSSSAIRKDGRVVGSRDIVQDITRRKRVQDDLQKAHDQLEQRVTERTRHLRKLNVELSLEIVQRKKAETALEDLVREKDSFIARLGHDLKTPLTPLLTLLPLVRKRQGDPKAAELLDVSIQNLKHIKDTVVKTLKHARFSSPHRKIEAVETPLRDQVEHYIRKRHYLIGKGRLTIENAIPASVAVMADHTEMEELFYNLLTNAIKHTPEGGSITLDAVPDGGFVTVSVRDTGIGLTDEERGHVFDEFYKVDESRHELDSSGLGLSICRKIVHKHGGRIWAESPGKGLGSTFFFTLEKAKQEGETS